SGRSRHPSTGRKTADDSVVRSVSEAPMSAVPRSRLFSGPLLGLGGVLTLFLILFAVRGELDRFVSLRNLQVLVHGDVITAVVALAMLLIIVSGGIDLSVGSVVALVPVVTMQLYRLVYARSGSMAWASLAAVPAGIGVGGVCGLVNGLVITRLRVAPF